MENDMILLGKEENTLRCKYQQICIYISVCVQGGQEFNLEENLIIALENVNVILKMSS